MFALQASIAVDEGDSGAALQLGRNLWCTDTVGDTRFFMVNPAKVTNPKP